MCRELELDSLVAHLSVYSAEDATFFFDLVSVLGVQKYSEISCPVSSDTHSTT